MTMTITYNPNDGRFIAVKGSEILAEGYAAPDLTLEEFLNTLIYEINAGMHSDDCVKKS